MDSDSLEELGIANPVDVDNLSVESHARIRAKVTERVAAHRGPSRRLLPASVLGVGATVVLVGTVGILLLNGHLGGGNAPVPGHSNDPIAASCVDPYRGPGSINGRSFAFDGTVTAISGEQVTFTVTRSYRGSIGATASLRAPGMTGQSITSAGGPILKVGNRYLVAGDDHFVWPCGYTQPYDQRVAAQWAAA
jgi:hypothetical protein